MIFSILLILIAWFVEMPLWLSVVTTVFAGINVFIRFLVLCYKLGKEINRD